MEGSREKKNKKEKKERDRANIDQHLTNVQDQHVFEGRGHRGGSPGTH